MNPTHTQDTTALDLFAAGPLVEAVLADGGLGRLAGCSDQDCESLYAMGYSLYSQARYADAMRIFALLVMLRSLEHRFICALASCLQMMGRHADAINHYATALTVDAEDPAPLLHTSECLVALGHLAHARECLDVIREEYVRESFPEIFRKADRLLLRMTQANVTQPGREK